MTCQCSQCTDTPGETYTEQYRRESEARHVCNISTREGRADYLKGIEEKRGFEAMIELRNEVSRQWELIKEMGNESRNR